MSTRSSIAIKHEDGSIDAIYCHNDGYLTNNGVILYKNYQDPAKVQQLINLGSISSLGIVPNQDPAVKKYGFLLDSTEFYKLSFDEQDKVWKSITGTIAYHRDRGEQLVISHYNSVKEFKKDSHDYSGAEYCYLYQQSSKTGKWSWKVETIHDHGEEFILNSVDHKLEEDISKGYWYSLAKLIKKYDKLSNQSLDKVA